MRFTALKQKHSKNEDDTKFMGTVLGKCNEHGDVQVEGGKYPSIFNWEERLKFAAERQSEPREDVEMNGDGGDSRPQSSGLSSLGDLGDELEMDLS
jgi:transcription initiation factor TFIID subunit 3